MPTHLKTKRTHDEARQHVCVLCFRKSNNSRKITERYSNAVAQHLPDFPIRREMYPCGLCGGCRIKIDTNRHITVTEYGEKNILVNGTDKLCDCDICLVAKAKPNSSNYEKPNPGRPRVTSPKQRLSVCSKCMTVLNKGKPHMCTVREKVKNILNVSGVHKEQIASRVLKDITNNLPSTSSAPILTLKRDRGAEMNVIVPNKKQRSSIENAGEVDAQVLKQMQVKNGQNMRQTQRTSQILRKAKIKVKWGAMSQVNKETHDLDAYYTVESVEIDVDKNVKEAMEVVYCSNLNGLVSHLLQKRRMDDRFLCKIGVDGGGGSLKVCMCVCVFSVG